MKQIASPSLLVILAEGFLSRLAFGIISFALPLFAYRKMGLSLTATGFLFSVNLIVEQLFKPAMGWLADRIGLKPSLMSVIEPNSAKRFVRLYCALTPHRVRSLW